MATGDHGDLGDHARVATDTDTATVTIHPLPTVEEIAVAVEPSHQIVMSVTIVMEDASTTAITLMAHIAADVVLAIDVLENDVFVSVSFYVFPF